MLDRQVVKEFLEEKFKDIELEIPEDIPEDVLVETFCRYVENDYYEWLKDNFKSFFDHGNPNWKWIKQRIEQYKKE
jgi:adenylate kinase family enzyme